MTIFFQYVFFDLFFILLISLIYYTPSTASNCTSEDIEYAKTWDNYYKPQEAYDFGVKIQNIIKAKDLKEATHPGILQYPGQPKSLLNDVIVLPYNDIERSKELINAHSEDLACLIMEPVISGLGYLPLEKNFLQFIRDITDELDIILIYDEIQSYRLAPGGAQEIFNITPDMTALGKIIGGGLPVGAFGGKEEIMETLNPSS